MQLCPSGEVDQDGGEGPVDIRCFSNFLALPETAVLSQTKNHKALQTYIVGSKEHW